MKKSLVGVLLIGGGGLAARVLHSALDPVAPPELPHWLVELISTAGPILIAWLVNSPREKK
jgi:hypothetical protein